MKTFAFVVLSVILSAAATPLGDRVVFRRHKGTPLSRRYILESRTDAPAACASVASSVPSATTTSPDLSGTDVPVADPTTADNSTDSTDPTLASNATVADPTATDNSTATTNSTATRRFWSRGGFGFSHGFSDGFSEHTSVSVSFEETVSTFVESWEDLCLSSGGDIFTGDPCTNLGGFYGIDALSETAEPCDQQELADSMITFAKGHGIRNRDALINYALSFRRHARHSVEILGVIPSSLFCLEAPINPELIGVYNEQFEGANPGLFGSPTTPMVPFGSSGTCPFGMTADVSSCGCVSSDGTTDSTSPTDSTDPSDASATDSADASAATDASSTDTADASAATDASSTDTADGSTATDAADSTSTDTADASATASTADAAVTPPPTSGPNFQPSDISGNVNDPNGRR